MINTYKSLVFVLATRRRNIFIMANIIAVPTGGEGGGAGVQKAGTMFVCLYVKKCTDAT